MAEIEIRRTNGEPSGRIVKLADAIFARLVDAETVYQSVVAYQVNQSQGTSSTRTRSEVSGGGAKPYRQKGTGRARQGSIRSPHYRGGGVVFGPSPHRARRRLPKRMRRTAACSALSDKHAEGAIMVIEPPELLKPRTRQVVELLKALDVQGHRVLFILDMDRPEFYKSARNIEQVEVRVAPSVTAYDVLWSSKVILFEGAAEKLAEEWA